MFFEGSFKINASYQENLDCASSEDIKSERSGSDSLYDR